MVRTVLAAGSVILLTAATTGCIQVDGLPAFTAGGEVGAAPPPRAGARLAAACEGAPEPRDRAWACLVFAGYVEQGIFGLRRDPARATQLRESAIQVLEASCDRGDVTDCTRAAMVIGTVIGPANEPAGATAEAALWMVEYADQGCRGGDARGCALLGVIHEGGRGVARDEARSTDSYDRACGGGHLPSCLLLASRAEGPAAVAAYERACRGGSGYGCAAAAQHHARGVGVPSSVSRAGALFERGCRLGNPAACVMGAELPEEAGPGRRRAVHLAWEACTMGIPDGCLLLGERIEREKGAHRAFEVYHRACELGDRRGCDAVRRVRGQEGPIDAAIGGDVERGD
jgi:TPR repeat protein